ncbi:hypothetical protein AGMMS50267_12750 [Spirochaetia bacterium]|nr:hypothetical protein AGMMS50267_12750 [Spirochaetia bacterium]
MKREQFTARFSLLLLASLALVSCYQDVEVDTSTPGSLLPVAGVYNMRDLGGYATYDNTMYAGQKLKPLQDIQETGNLLKALQGGDTSAMATLPAEWDKMKAALGTTLTGGVTDPVWADLGGPNTSTVIQAAGMGVKQIQINIWNSIASGLPEFGFTGGLTFPADVASPLLGEENFRSAAATIQANMTPKQVKHGVIIRSGDLSLLTDRDITYLADTFHISAVIDFRGIAPASGGRAAERSGKNLDRDIPGALMGHDTDPSPIGGYPRIGADAAHSATISAGLEGKFGNRFAIEEGVVGSMAQYLGPDKSAADTEKVMIAGYRNFMEQEAKLTSDQTSFGGSAPYEASGRQQMHNFFRYLIYENGWDGAFREAPVPVIFHCSAGKDRTGIAAALFYSALGIPRETIISDYLLSAQYVAEKYTPVVNGLGAQLEPLVSVRREYIESMFTYIDETFPQNRWETATDETATLNYTVSGMASNPPFNGYGPGAAAVAAGYLYGTKRAEAGKNVFPNASYDNSAAVIKFLTAPLPQTARFTYALNQAAGTFSAVDIKHPGGLGLTMDEIYQLRKLYLE